MIPYSHRLTHRILPDGCLRPPLSDVELARLRHLRTLDGKKLARLLPSWAKPFTLPKPWVFTPNREPVFPAWTYRKWSPAKAWSMADRQFPGPLLIDDPACYIRTFEDLNHLRSLT